MEKPQPLSAKRPSGPPHPMEAAQDPARQLHVGRPNVGDRATFDRWVDEMFDRRWFTNDGQLVQTFERELARRLEVRHALAVCNATIGLEIAYRVLGMTGEILLPAYTFVATAHAASWIGARPVFVEPDPETHNIDVRQIERAITPRTTGIVGVHLWGRPCDTQRIDALARRHGLPVVYDAAHAFAVRGPQRMVGGHGDCEVFSFHATKFFNTFEGGAITTNDDALAARLRLARNFGFRGPDSVEACGTNGKMTEVCAAMGLANLESIPRFIETNRAHHRTYRGELESLPGLRLLDYADLPQTNWQYVVIEIDEARGGVSRDAVYERLRENGILAKRYFYPGCHRMQPYATLDPHGAERYPLTDRLCHRVLCLPNGTAVSRDDVRRVTRIIREAWPTRAEGAAGSP